MDQIITSLVSAILSGAPGALAAIGWLLYIVERYYVSPNREKQHRIDLAASAASYRELSERTADAITKFTTILEVLKDRVGRN